MERLPEHILSKIQSAKERRLVELDLSWEYGMPESDQLIKVPDQVFELENLATLKLKGNNLTELPPEIGRLTNLSVLVLSDNSLCMLPSEVGQLTDLSVLALNSNNLSMLPSEIGQLTNLISLDLGNNQLTALPPEIGQLINLSALTLSGNALTALPAEIVQLADLTELSLSVNGLMALPTEILQMTSLFALDLDGNELTVLPPEICQLTNLTRFYLGSNRLTMIPPEIGLLANLTILDLRFNQLVALPNTLGQLRKLIEFYVSGNPLETPPIEIARRGAEAIRDYFRQLEAEGVDYLCEAKLLIVGEPGAGKTTLAKKIQDPNYSLSVNEASTKGIDVIQWVFSMADGRPFKVNIWDFGGQEIYHATHQFFLTKRSLYMLVVDTRRDDTDFYYWLNAVEFLSDNSPLLIVKNEKQNRHREIDEQQLRGRFDNLKETLATNLATNRGLNKIFHAIQYHICSLPLVDNVLPKNWVRVRQELEQDPRNYVNLDEYLDICVQAGFTQREDALQLSDYLHDLGVCLHFKDDPLLKKTVIIKPEWVTDAVYKVLDNPRVIRNLGQFTKVALEDIWFENRYTGMQDELLRLMIKFQLCYEILDKSDTYIAPQLLTANKPEYKWDEHDNLHLRYTYEGFVPKGIVTRFIVMMHQWIADQICVWRSGVVLEREKAKAEVIEHFGTREIRIRVSGMHKRDWLTILIYELDKIHESFRQLKYDKLIPCNCPICKASDERHFFRMEDLKRFRAAKQSSIQCLKSFQMVNVKQLIDDVISRQDSRFDIGSEWDHKARIELHKILTTRFNLSGLKTLCFHIGVDFADLPGDGKAAKVEELIAFCNHRFSVGKLVETGRQLRSDIEWPRGA